jgi:hypothetical protein
MTLSSKPQLRDNAQEAVHHRRCSGSRDRWEDDDCLGDLLLALLGVESEVPELGLPSILNTKEELEMEQTYEDGARNSRRSADSHTPLAIREVIQ